MLKFFFAFTLACFFHGNNIAKFTITKDATGLYIIANLDASDLALDLNGEAQDITIEDLQTYLYKHTVYVVNNQHCSQSITDFKIEQDHFIVTSKLSGEFNKIHTLRIKNTALIKVNTKQSNIIELRFDGLYRDFLIDENQPILNITL